MSSFHEHEAEQAAITAMCEAGTCDHPSCHAPRRYTVLITRDITESVSITVSARTREEAADLALDELESSEFASWAVDDAQNAGPHRVTSIDEA